MVSSLYPQRPDGADVDGAAAASITVKTVRKWSQWSWWWWRGREARSLGEDSSSAAAASIGRSRLARSLAPAAGPAPGPLAPEAPRAAALLPVPAAGAPRRATDATWPLALATTPSVNPRNHSKLLSGYSKSAVTTIETRSHRFPHGTHEMRLTRLRRFKVNFKLVPNRESNVLNKCKIIYRCTLIYNFKVPTRKRYFELYLT